MAVTDFSTFISAWCSLGPRPILVNGLLRLHLIQHFSTDTDIEHEPFKTRLFKNDETTPILIEDANLWTPKMAQKRPAVTLKRNAWQSVKRGTLDNTSGQNSEGDREHCKLGQGSHTLNCICKEPGEAEMLGAEVYRFFMHYGPVIRHYARLLMFELMHIGACTEMEESKEHYAVPITVGYGWAENWTINTAAPRLAKIKLSDLFKV